MEMKMSDIKGLMQQLGENARAASREMAAASTEAKNQALLHTAAAIEANRKQLASANAEDLDAGKAKGLSAAMIERLELTPTRINNIIEGLQQVAALVDPVGEISDLRYMPSGIQVGRMRVPLGVIGIIYESRPNVTAEAASIMPEIRQCQHSQGWFRSDTFKHSRSKMYGTGAAGCRSV